MSLTIRIHLDLDLLNGMADDSAAGKIDAIASLRAYVAELDTRLCRTYPNAAEIDVTYSPRTGGNESRQVLDAELNADETQYELIDMLMYALHADTNKWLRFE